MREGLCNGKDPAIWFPDGERSIVHAQRICDVCPVKQTCAEYAIARPSLVGCWGGLSSRQRERIRGQRNRAARQAVG